MRYDVVVVGGGSAGVAAAVGAARTGASVCLVERYPFFGGAATVSSVLSYCGFFDQTRERVVAGVGELLLARLRAAGAYQEITFRWSGNTVVMIDPEFTKLALDGLVRDAGVTPLLGGYVTSAGATDDRVDHVTVSHHGSTHEIGAATFVDASGEGDLAALAGAATTVVPAPSRQAATLGMRIGGVAPDAVISSDLMREAVARFNETHDARLVRDHGPAARLPLSGEITMQIVDQDVDALDLGDATRAELAAREQAWQYLEAFRDHMPGWDRAYLVATGPQIGVRESRHLVGRTTLTREDVVSARRRPEAVVARCGWPIEEHEGIGKTRYTPIAGKSFYDIPLDALRSIDRENLWAAGRLLSADEDAFCSARVMGTAFATGHAAGVGAALEARGREPLVSDVQRELRTQYALI
jgi:2-polyprenyl-6-methoxyphenol hydroxylase-like FAD-dependent oxidoreductase